MSRNRDLSTVVVIDVESTCWEKGANSPNQVNEIIEIGVCEVDTTHLERVRRATMLVRPERSTVSEFCTDLTGLTQEKVNEGVAFEHACEWLKEEFKVRDRIWASYGDYDRVQFQRQCDLFRVPYPFGRTHLNIKSLFALSRQLAREMGMDEALRLLKLPLEGKHHRAEDDAWNVGMILLRTLWEIKLYATT